VQRGVGRGGVREVLLLNGTLKDERPSPLSLFLFLPTWGSGQFDIVSEQEYEYETPLDSWPEDPRHAWSSKEH